MQKARFMKKKEIISILILIMISGFCFSQQINDNIDYIAFKFEHSRRIPYNQVTIEINKRESETEVKVHSIPMNNDKQWENTKIDKSFKIDTKLFTELANEVMVLNKIDLKKALTGGLDGTECSIEFGTFGSTVTYKFFSPDVETENRDLIDFLNICKKIIEIGGFNPKDIL
jgi:hypothetical protein